MKKNIHCERCGKRERIGECHERITHKDHSFYLCVDCSQIAYKIKDAIIDGNFSDADELVQDFSSLPDTINESLSDWFTEYKTRIGFSPGK